MKKYIYLLSLIFSLCSSHGMQEEIISPYPPTLYQLAQIHFNALENPDCTYVGWGDKIDLVTPMLNDVSDAGNKNNSMIIDILYDQFENLKIQFPDKKTLKPLFINNGKTLVKIACDMEASAALDNKHVLWRYSSPNHFPEKLSFSLGLFSGLFNDGINQYQQTGDLRKGYSACTFIYFANCEFSRKIFGGGLTFLQEEFINSFPEYFSNAQNTDNFMALSMDDEEDYLEKTLGILKFIQIDPSLGDEYGKNKNKELINRVFKFYNEYLNSFKYINAEDKAQAQCGEIHAFIISKAQLAQFNYIHGSSYQGTDSADRAIHGRGEDFHPKIQMDMFKKLLENGCENKVIYRNGEFLL